MNFFSKILTPKKTLLFILLLLVVTGFIMPGTALAWSWPWEWAASEVASGLLNVLIGIFFALPLFFVTIAATISKIIFSLAETLALNTSYTNTDAVKLGWPIIRDLANMMVVLGFVVIGIATTLRFKDYEAKKLLLPLIIAALLINFSLVICGIFIDGSNILMRFFFDKAAVAGGGWITPTVDLFNLIGSIGTHSPLEFASILIGMTFFYFIEFFVDFLYGFLLLCRLVAISMLVILSPLAFVCYVFPATRGIWQMWWKKFFQWCIVIVPAGLFYYIGEMLISKKITNDPFDLDKIIAAGPATFFANQFQLVLVPGLFLIVGFFISLQFSAMGISTIFSFANKHKGKALSGGLGALSKASGVAGKYAGKAGDYLSGSKIGKWSGLAFAAKMAGKGGTFVGNSAERTRKAKSWAGRVLEGAGAIPAGTQAGKDSKDLASAIAALTAALRSGNKQDQQRVFDKIHNGDAAAISAAVSEGRLHEAFKDPGTGAVNHSAMNDALLAAEKSGAPKNMRKDALDKYYQVAGFTDKNVDAALTSLGHKGAIDAELTTQGIAIGTATPAQRMAAARSLETSGGLAAGTVSRAEEKANYTKLGQNWSSMDLEAKANADLGGLHPDDLKEFSLSRNAEDIKAFKLLDAGHDNRTTHKTTMLAHVNAELATPGISTNRQRRLQEVRDELMKL
ncbi:MAG: hypothetical protein Q8Q48_01865 [Candidatus Staskawiczbacteria bacterium]|nr:hypothetical protein [Candidatus Staskawiczbacteria bacterium]